MVALELGGKREHRLLEQPALGCDLVGRDRLELGASAARLAPISRVAAGYICFSVMRVSFPGWSRTAVAAG